MLKWLAAFFGFGTTMCALTIALLLFPGTFLDALWGLNPDAHVAFRSLGWSAVLIMLVVGSGCAFAAIGLWQETRWGTWTAIIVLSANLVGDVLNVLIRHDYRALIGLPIGGAMIFYLVRSAKAVTQSTP